MNPSPNPSPLRPAILAAAIGGFLLTVMVIVMTGQANGIHGNCHDASWYYFSAVFLPAGVIISMPFTIAAIYAGVVCAKRAIRFGRWRRPVLASLGVVMSLAALAGLAADMYSIRDLFLGHPTIASNR